MRLGQLARQLEIKPEKILSFLEKNKQLILGEHPNTKVPDELIEEITTHFKPVVEEEIIIEELEVAPEVIKEETIIEEAPLVKKEPEHISAPSLKVDGPKIIGKIDIPDKTQIQVEVDGVVYDQATLDKKKKDELEAERNRKALEKEQKRQEEKEKREKVIEQRRIEAERQEMLKNEEHNILTAEEERKRTAKENKAREREAKLEKKRKQKQKEFYAKQHATKKVTAKKQKSENVKSIKKSIELKEGVGQPVEEVVQLSGFKKFLKWLNT